MNVANVEKLPITNTNFQLETGNIGTGNIGTGNIGTGNNSTLATFVEPVDSIVKHFVGGAMSLGSLSPEAHEIGRASCRERV